MGLIGGIARTAVIAGTASAVSNRVTRYQSGRWAAQDQSQSQRGYIPPPPGTYYGRYQYPMFQQPAAGQPPLPAYPPPAYASPGAYTPPPPPADEMSVRLAQLQQLGSLKDQGVITEAEFAAQKQRILGT